MIRFFESILGLVKLFILFKGQFFNRYWSWRKETAFGKNPKNISFFQKCRVFLEFGRWFWKMTHLKKKKHSSNKQRGFYIFFTLLFLNAEVIGKNVDFLNDEKNQKKEKWIFGYQDGYRVERLDGSFAVEIEGAVQARWLCSKGSGTSNEKNKKQDLRLQSSEIETRVRDYTNLFSFDMRVQLAKNITTGNDAEILKSYFSFEPNQNLKISIGRFLSLENKFSRTSVENQVGPDVPIVADISSIDGIKARWRDRFFEVEGALTRGIAAQVREANDISDRSAITLRGGILLAGTWDSMSSFSSEFDSPLGLFLGSSFHYENADIEGGGDGDFTRWSLEAHLNFEGSAFSFLYQKENVNDLSINPEAGPDPWSCLLQGSRLVSESWMLYAQGQIFDFDTSGSPLGEVWRAGVAWQPNNNWKFHMDFGKANAPITWILGGNESGQGWRQQSSNGDDQRLFRIQSTFIF